MAMWAMPSEKRYLRLQASFPGCFERPYAYLRREYELLLVRFQEERKQHDWLRGEYQAGRRHFALQGGDACTDVWEFATVKPSAGKHPCEKPEDMMRHMVLASSREGGAVLDPFAGSGVLGKVCGELGRSYTGIEADERWFRTARRRVFCAASDLSDTSK